MSATPRYTLVPVDEGDGPDGTFLLRVTVDGRTTEAVCDVTCASCQGAGEHHQPLERQQRDELGGRFVECRACVGHGVVCARCLGSLEQGALDIATCDCPLRRADREARRARAEAVAAAQGPITHKHQDAAQRGEGG